MSSKKEDLLLLKRLCRQGIPYRYPSVPKGFKARLTKELEVINQQGFVSYFLINWDILSYARSKGYFYVGFIYYYFPITFWLIYFIETFKIDKLLSPFVDLYISNSNKGSIFYQKRTQIDPSKSSYFHEKSVQEFDWFRSRYFIDFIWLLVSQITSFWWPWA